MSTIGKVNESGGKKIDQEKQAFLSSISYEFLSMFIGLIDGYIAITKIGLDNIRMVLILILSVGIKDLKLLQHIKKVLKNWTY